jgi:hypothetical protein
MELDGKVNNPLVTTIIKALTTAKLVMVLVTTFGCLVMMTNFLTDKLLPHVSGYYELDSLQPATIR